MMRELECPGFAAEWLNGWLAAVGLLVLEPRLRLRWTEGVSPAAVISCAESEPLSLALGAWPDADRLDRMPIERNGIPRLDRKVSVEDFRARAELARDHSDGWTLSSTLTDLRVDRRDGTLWHAPLDPSSSGPAGTLHDRLVRTYRLVTTPDEMLPASLAGTGRRVAANGLGFDARRIAGPADDSTPLTDPVIEVLAFFGLRLLPARGTGIEVAATERADPDASRQRCWQTPREGTNRGQRMHWPAWSHPLDLWGVDALLDSWSRIVAASSDARRLSRAALKRLRIHAGWRTVAYQWKGSSDTTRGFASEEIFP